MSDLVKKHLTVAQMKSLTDKELEFIISFAEHNPDQFKEELNINLIKEFCQYCVKHNIDPKEPLSIEDDFE